MKKEKQNSKTKKVKTSKNEKSMKILNRPILAIVYCLTIILISLVAIFGIYVQDKTEMINLLPEYTLGSDLYGRRELLVKPSENAQEALSDEEKEEIIENYIKSKDIITERLKDLKVKYYELKFNEYDGSIRVEVPENDDADYVSEYLTTKGEFKISDNETEDVLLSNKDIKKVQAGTYAGESGTTVYFSIQLKKDAVEKLKEISNTYIKSTDDEGNENGKKIKMTLDESTMMTSSFDEEISNGTIQLTMGSSKDNDKVKEYLNNANRIAILLNHDPLPNTLTMQSNRFVYSYITKDTINVLVISGAIVLGVISLYMIFRYKIEGFVCALANVGLLALLLIVIRYTNVSLTLLGMTGIAIISLVNYLMLMSILKINKTSNLDKNEKQIEIEDSMIKYFEILIPLGITAIIFALTSWETMISLGTVLFWGIVIMVIYSFITLKVLFLDKKTKKPEKKQEFHQM